MNREWLIAKATILANAWQRVTGAAPPNMNALALALAQAIHESSAGDCWDTSGNWGCCDLRALNAAEVAAFKSGALEVGWWLYPDGTYGPEHRPDATGTIRGDSDPNSGPFHVWFFAGPQDAGAAYYLRAGVRSARHVLDDPECTAETFATALYVEVCYFGGVHRGSRPCGHRAPPFNAAEIANIGDYALAMTRLLAVIEPALDGWTPPGMTPPEHVDDDRIVGAADVAPAVAVIDLPSEDIGEPHDVEDGAS